MSNDRILLAERTCTNCSKSETCHAYIELKKLCESWPIAGFVGAGAPGCVDDVYMSFANGCLLFEFKKLGK